MFFQQKNNVYNKYIKKRRVVDRANIKILQSVKDAPGAD